MGLERHGAFSRDILELEVSGPSLPNLTLVDLPGLIQTPGKHQSSDDVAIVNKLTESYMNNPRSIVLAVVSAERTLGQQLVLHMTKYCSSRTMAIITKPDILDPGSAGEATFYARAKNQDTPLRLGWHVLRNTDSATVKNRDFGRDDVEKLFFATTTPWNLLSSNSVGIESLRNRLSKILLGQIETQLSSLRSDIQRELEKNRTQLLKFGPSRNSSTEQRFYLTTLAERFQSLTRAAVQGEYRDPFFRYHPQRSHRRLRSVIRNWGENFAADMEGRGHTYQIYDDATQNHPDPTPSPPDPNQPMSVAKSTFIYGLAELLKQSKGRDIPGLVNSHVIGELFIRCSLRWNLMARTHVFEIWKTVKRFQDDLLHHIAGASVGKAILRAIVEHEMAMKLRRLNRKIDELMAPYKRLIPSTLNQQFTAKIHRLRRKSREQFTDKEVELATCSDILECMQAYYEVALGVFIDNVAGLAVEGCLIDPLENIISPSKIAQMSDSEIEILGANSEDLELSRTQLSEKVKVLEIALTSCDRCEMAALSSSAQNYRETPAENEGNSVTVSSDTSSQRMSPTSSTSARLSPPDLSNVPQSPKPTKQVTMLRPFPRPAQISGLVRANGIESPQTAPTSPVGRLLSPPPKSPARAVSVSVDGDEADTATKNPKKHSRNRATTVNQALVFEDKPTPWPASPVKGKMAASE
jgi:hypothetical protein